jgi:exosortase
VLVAWSGILLGLVILLYGPTLKGLIQQWWRDPDYSYGFFVPLFSAYVLWHRRDRWLKSDIKPANFGFLVMLGAIGLLLLGSLGAELFTSRVSLLVLLAGMILFLCGTKVLRDVSFPLGFLIFMIPLPVIIYNQITFPLQLIASRWATSWLELAQVPVLRDGNVLVFANYSLGVIEACSGIRSLMSLLALAVAYGHLAERRRWARYALVVLTVPTTLVTNALRITMAGALAHRFGAVAAEGFLHEFSGWAIFLSALALMFGCHWVLQRNVSLQAKMSHA